MPPETPETPAAGAGGPARERPASARKRREEEAFQMWDSWAKQEGVAKLAEPDPAETLTSKGLERELRRIRDRSQKAEERLLQSASMRAGIRAEGPRGSTRDLVARSRTVGRELATDKDIANHFVAHSGTYSPRSPGGRSPGWRSPSGRSPGGRSPVSTRPTSPRGPSSPTSTAYGFHMPMASPYNAEYFELQEKNRGVQAQLEEAEATIKALEEENAVYLKRMGRMETKMDQMSATEIEHRRRLHMYQKMEPIFNQLEENFAFDNPEQVIQKLELLQKEQIEYFQEAQDAGELNKVLQQKIEGMATQAQAEQSKMAVRLEAVRGKYEAEAASVQHELDAAQNALRRSKQKEITYLTLMNMVTDIWSYCVDNELVEPGTEVKMSEPAQVLSLVKEKLALLNPKAASKALRRLQGLANTAWTAHFQDRPSLRGQSAETFAALIDHATSLQKRVAALNKRNLSSTTNEKTLKAQLKRNEISQRQLQAQIDRHNQRILHKSASRASSVGFFTPHPGPQAPMSVPAHRGHPGSGAPPHRGRRPQSARPAFHAGAGQGLEAPQDRSGTTDVSEEGALFEEEDEGLEEEAWAGEEEAWEGLSATSRSISAVPFSVRSRSPSASTGVSISEPGGGGEAGGAAKPRREAGKKTRTPARPGSAPARKKAGPPAKKEGRKRPQSAKRRAYASPAMDAVERSGTAHPPGAHWSYLHLKSSRQT